MSKDVHRAGINRRAFITAGIGDALLPWLLHAASAASSIQLFSPVCFNGQYALFQVNGRQPEANSSLPFRAHGLVLDPRNSNRAASVAYDQHSDSFALACPMGDTLAIWKADRHYKGRIAFSKASGVTFTSGKGYASNELGQICQFDASSLKASLFASKAALEWDNHLYAGRLEIRR